MTEKLTDKKKAELWQQRFFEAQAACEQFIIENYGESALDLWIEENSSITAKLLQEKYIDNNQKLECAVNRLVDQLLCYESDISSRKVGKGYKVENKKCGILTYRKIAASAGVKLTFKRPCDYCMKLNRKIIRKFSGCQSVDVELFDEGCEWSFDIE